MDPQTKQYLDDQHSKIYDELLEIKMQMKPITRIYNSVAGFGSVSWALFRFIIVPISVLVAIYYEIVHGTNLPK